MLKKNPIVKAAVAEAKKFTGAKTCKYTIESSEPEQFQKGTTFDYSAEITCSENPDEFEAMIRVRGRMFSPDGPQALTLSIDFAG
jgi:azurin